MYSVLGEPMRLNAKIIKNVSNVNHWEYADSAYVQEGQVNEFYFQLVDLDKIHSAEKSKALPDFPLRYMPQGTVVTVSVTFPDLDPTVQFSAAATQPFADDKSIWKVTLASNQLPNSGAAQITVTEDGVSRSFNLKNAIKVEMQNRGGC